MGPWYFPPLFNTQEFLQEPESICHNTHGNHRHRNRQHDYQQRHTFNACYEQTRRVRRKGIRQIKTMPNFFVS